MAEIAAIAHADAGIVIAAGKTSMVQSRLTKRLRVLNLPSYASYLALVKDPAGIAERHEMISSLTTNVSHFFRENHHFEAPSQGSPATPDRRVFGPGTGFASGRRAAPTGRRPIPSP